MHVDLSFNKFSLEDSEKVSKIISSNNTMFGFHFDGNVGVVDNL